MTVLPPLIGIYLSVNCSSVLLVAVQDGGGWMFFRADFCFVTYLRSLCVSCFNTVPREYVSKIKYQLKIETNLENH